MTTVNGEPHYTHEDVNKMISLVQEAQLKLEEAARMVCSSHNVAGIAAYRAWANLAREVGDSISNTPLYKLRPED